MQLKLKQLKAFTPFQGGGAKLKSLSSSILLTNRLTKSSFFLNDTGFRKMSFYEEYEQKDKVKQRKLKTSKPASLRILNLHRERNWEGNLFKTNIGDAPLKKFKLLFEDRHIDRQCKYKSASERKINRVQSKITSLMKHNNALAALLPQQSNTIQQSPRVPKGVIVAASDITQALSELIYMVELYFGIHKHDNLVAAKMKQTEGFIPIFQEMLMFKDKNTLRAKRALQLNQLQQYFWVFKPSKSRPLFFGEEDFAKFKSLNSFILKLESKSKEEIRSFSSMEMDNMKRKKQSLAQIVNKYEREGGKRRDLRDINKFIEDRHRSGNERIEEYLRSIEKSGKKISEMERNRGMVLREKEKAVRVLFENYQADC